MIFDTDILVWIQRGNLKASAIFSEESNRNISILSYMELIQCAKDKNQIRTIGKLVRDYSINVLPVSRKKTSSNELRRTSEVFGWKFFLSQARRR